jgi:hypothetical protein
MSGQTQMSNFFGDKNKKRPSSSAATTATYMCKKKPKSSDNYRFRTTPSMLRVSIQQSQLNKPVRGVIADTTLPATTNTTHTKAGPLVQKLRNLVNSTLPKVGQDGFVYKTTGRGLQAKKMHAT